MHLLFLKTELFTHFIRLIYFDNIRNAHYNLGNLGEGRMEIIYHRYQYTPFIVPFIIFITLIMFVKDYI